MVVQSVLLLLLATTALAAPSKDNNCHGACTVPASAFILPAGLPALTSAPRYTAVGVGMQNYTCASGKYSSIGAVARLFDASCLYGKPEFLTIENDTYNIWNQRPDYYPQDTDMANQFKKDFNIDPIGNHYFAYLNGTLSPVFDFTSTGRTKGNPNAIFFGKKIADVPSPDGSLNVDWLALQNVSGQLSTMVYRIKTVKGQPPATCTPGSPNITVKYAAQYLFE